MKMNKVGCIVQARMGSTRLPGKILKNLENEKVVLDFVIEQLQHSKNIDEIVIATTNLDEDEQIVEISKKKGIKCFRGSSKNVLERHYQCAKQFDISTIVRIPSDKPLIDPTIVDKIIDNFKKKSSDYMTNFLPNPTFPEGTEVEVFSMKALEIAWKNANLPSEKEHVTNYFENNQNLFKINNIKNSENLSHLRWVIDRKEDLELVREIVSKIKKRPILTLDIIKMFSEFPELIKINENVNREEGNLKSLQEDKNFSKKMRSE
jgi:spore coat polysaccharide biosynthesis protein SpsF